MCLTGKCSSQRRRTRFFFFPVFHVRIEFRSLWLHVGFKRFVGFTVCRFFWLKGHRVWDLEQHGHCSFCVACLSNVELHNFSRFTWVPEARDCKMLVQTSLRRYGDMQKMRAAVFGTPYYKVNIVFCSLQICIEAPCLWNPPPFQRLKVWDVAFGVWLRVRFWVGALGRPALVAERVAHRPNSLS